MNNHIHVYQWDIIAHPYPNSNGGGFIITPLKLWQSARLRCLLTHWRYRSLTKSHRNNHNCTWNQRQVTVRIPAISEELSYVRCLFPSFVLGYQSTDLSRICLTLTHLTKVFWPYSAKKKKDVALTWNNTGGVMSQFCTCHDSRAVVTCAKERPDRNNKTIIT